MLLQSVSGGFFLLFLRSTFSLSCYFFVFFSLFFSFFLFFLSPSYHENMWHIPMIASLRSSFSLGFVGKALYSKDFSRLSACRISSLSLKVNLSRSITSSGQHLLFDHISIITTSIPLRNPSPRGGNKPRN